MTRGINVSDVQINEESLWNKIKKKNKEIKYFTLNEAIIDNEGKVIEEAVQIPYVILSKSQLDALDEKYTSMKQPEPTKIFNKLTGKWVDILKSDPEYTKWQKECARIDNSHWAEATILALVDKPEGNTLEDQVNFLKDALGGGFYDRLTIDVMKSSGYNINTEIEKAKKD